jgi:hypothetical protein
MKDNKKTIGVWLTAIFVLSMVALIGLANTSANADNTKYGKYIVTEPAPPADTPASNLDEQPKDMLTQMTYLDNEVVKGAYYTECSWLMKAYPDRVWVKEHKHDFDEVFGFYGSDANNPKDLGGEVELWIGGERHLITKSCLVFVPKGLKHCPLTIKKVDKPIFMFTSGPSSEYKS